MSYMGTHNKIRRIRGKAADRICICGAPAREWAYDHSDPDEVTDSLGRRYSRSPDHYVAMCKPCHQKFDKSEITHCPRGHSYEGTNLIIDSGKRKCRTCVYKRNAERRSRVPMTPEQRSRKNELQRKRRANERGEVMSP